MAITRDDIESHLSDLTARVQPPYADPVAAEAFKGAAIALFCEHYEKFGWPDAMPKFAVIPPSRSPRDPLPMDGYAGFEFDGRSAMWRMRFGEMKFDVA